jgi:hypothetical protein
LVCGKYQGDTKEESVHCRIIPYTDHFTKKNPTFCFTIEQNRAKKDDMKNPSVEGFYKNDTIISLYVLDIEMNGFFSVFRVVFHTRKKYIN